MSEDEFKALIKREFKSRLLSADNIPNITVNTWNKIHINPETKLLPPQDRLCLFILNTSNDIHFGQYYEPHFTDSDGNTNEHEFHCFMDEFNDYPIDEKFGSIYVTYWLLIPSLPDD